MAEQCMHCGEFIGHKPNCIGLANRTIADLTRKLAVATGALETAIKGCKPCLGTGYTPSFYVGGKQETCAACSPFRAALDAHLARLHEQLRISIATLETIASDPDDTAIEALERIRALGAA